MADRTDLIHHRDHTPYSYYGDGPHPDPLFETAARWGLDVEAIKAAVSEQSKPTRAKQKRELPERIAHRQMVVELHPGFVRFREKHSRTSWDISWESIYWKAAEIQAQRNRGGDGHRWRKRVPL